MWELHRETHMQGKGIWSAEQSYIFKPQHSDLERATPTCGLLRAALIRQEMTSFNYPPRPCNQWPACLQDVETGGGLRRQSGSRTRQAAPVWHAGR